MLKRPTLAVGPLTTGTPTIRLMRRRMMMMVVMLRMMMMM
jgi:hypothetical protein